MPEENNADSILVDGALVNGAAIEIPDYKSRMYFNKDLAFDFIYPRPNFWWRLGHYFFFGIKWKKLPDDSK